MTPHLQNQEDATHQTVNIPKPPKPTTENKNMDEKNKVLILALKGALHSARTAAELCEMLEGLGVRCTLTASGTVHWPESDKLILGGDFWSFAGESLEETARLLAVWAKEPRKSEGFVTVAHLGPDELFAHLLSLGLKVRLYPEEGRIVGERVQWKRTHSGWRAGFADELAMEEAIRFEAGSPPTSSTEPLLCIREEAPLGQTQPQAADTSRRGQSLS